MSKGEQDIAMFVSFCIEQYAKAKHMPTKDVVNMFEQYGITDFYTFRHMNLLRSYTFRHIKPMETYTFRHMIKNN